MNIFINLKDVNEILLLSFEGEGITGDALYEQLTENGENLDVKIMNGAVYDLKTHKNVTYIKPNNWDGYQTGHLFSNEGIAVIGKKKLVLMDRIEAMKSRRVRNFQSGAPLFMKDGRAHIEWGNRQSHDLSENNYRSFEGFNSQFMMLCASDNRLYIEAAIAAGFRLKCDVASMSDGGYSRYLRDGVNVLVHSNRKNVTWRVVTMKKR